MMNHLLKSVDDLTKENKELLDDRQYNLLYRTRSINIDKTNLYLRRAIEAHLLMKKYKEEESNGKSDNS